MVHFIDRRLNAKGKSTVNRQRFVRRYKEQIKRAVSDSVEKRSVTDVNTGGEVVIPAKDVSEPIFHTTRGGKRDVVHPGNDQFLPGDKIPRPQQGQGQGGDGEASNTGEGDDDFVFQISKDEYLDLLFEDLALPNLMKNQLDKLVEYETYRAGYQSDGVPSNLDIVRSLKGAVARRIAVSSSARQALRDAEEELAALKDDKHDHHLRIVELEKVITNLKAKIAKVPFIDTFDLKFRNFDTRAVPTSKAVMFCIMDVSGSMDQATKDMAKRFYILLYLFLTRSYKNVEVVYIRHHIQAKEVDEEEFFYSQETGGTIVSSALTLMNEIVQERYANGQWNIYAAQASDGDNWEEDSPKCAKLLQNNILPLVRYFAYVEITERSHQSLWNCYSKLTGEFDNFALQHIIQVDDIYPVFRELFKKQKAA